MRQVVCMNINDENSDVADDLKCIKAEKRRRIKNQGRRLRRKKQRGVRKSAIKAKTRKKPKTMRKCNKHPCPFKWVPGDWSQVCITSLLSCAK